MEKVVQVVEEGDLEVEGKMMISSMREGITMIDRGLERGTALADIGMTTLKMMMSYLEVGLQKKGKQGHHMDGGDIRPLTTWVETHLGIEGEVSQGVGVEV